MYEELWRACAGPLVEVPQVGEKVYYFPQGHMEQVSFCLKCCYLCMKKDWDISIILMIVWNAWLEFEIS